MWPCLGLLSLSMFLSLCFLKWKYFLHGLFSVWACVPSFCMEVGGQCLGVSFLFPEHGFWGLSGVLRPGAECFCELSSRLPQYCSLNTILSSELPFLGKWLVSEAGWGNENQCELGPSCWDKGNMWNCIYRMIEPHLKNAKEKQQLSKSPDEELPPTKVQDNDRRLVDMWQSPICPGVNAWMDKQLSRQLTNLEGMR